MYFFGVLQHEPETSIYQVTPQTELPSNVRSRIAARLDSIRPDVQAIADDLGEFGLTYISFEVGSAKIAIGSSQVTFHAPPIESESYP